MARSLWERAIFLLSRREYSKKEIFSRLMRYEDSNEESVHALIEKLENLNYVNDLRFAQSCIRQKSARFGNRKIVADLKEKGVDSSVIEEAFRLAEDEHERCFLLWQKKFSSPQNAQEFARQGRFLCARGFQPSIVRALLKKMQANP